jgi:16S rRNA (cytosine967-C5)-methyltransferase
MSHGSGVRGSRDRGPRGARGAGVGRGSPGAERITPGRIAALEALRRVRGGELLDRALDAAGAELEPRERAWTHELVYGTIRLRGRIDHLLAALLRGGLDATQADVLDVLRLGAYQLLEMGSVPAYAAVSQSQELARSAGLEWAVRLIAGVLHALQRRGDAIPFPDSEREPAAHLAARASHPRWLVDRWIARWGLAQARALADANNLRPELFLRPLGLGLDEARARLGDAGVESEPVAFSATTLRILPPFTAVEALAAVPAVVQDPAAALVVEFAAVPRGARVVDLCAAPGGKALGMAEHAALVAAADLSPRRLERVRDNATRAGLAGRVLPVVADGRHPPFAPSAADVVLLDAPCSGTGTLRRHPDGRWRVRPEELDALVALQRELLDKAARLVRPGGVLVYSTCSLEDEENHEQVKGFLTRTPGWFLDAPPPALAREVLDGDLLLALPQTAGFDGAFAARLRRAG